MKPVYDEVRKELGSYMHGLRLARSTILFTIYGFFLVLAVPIYLYVLPDLEAAYAPPIIDQKISNLHLKPNDNSYLLWHWQFKKVRRATPEYITFMAWSEDDPEARFNVDTYVGWDCKANFRSDRTSMPSETPIERDVCVKLPPVLIGRNDIHVDGIIDFKMGHSLYTVPVRIPADRASWPPSDDITVPRSVPAQQ